MRSRQHRSISFSSGAQCRLFRGISRQRRFSRHACLHNPHPKQTILSIAHSQAVCLVISIGFEPKQVIISRDTYDIGPYRVASFKALIDADLTDSPVVPRLITPELHAYLDQYFNGWRLLRRVEELRRNAAGHRSKHVYYVIQVGTDADAETLRSRLVHTDYKVPKWLD